MEKRKSLNARLIGLISKRIVYGFTGPLYLEDIKKYKKELKKKRRK